MAIKWLVVNVCLSCLCWKKYAISSRVFHTRTQSMLFMGRFDPVAFVKVELGQQFGIVD